MSNLSDAALALLKLGVELPPTEENRDACRELEEQGLFVLRRPFVGQPAYRPTPLGWKLIDVLERMGPSGPSPG